jgi:hypothetical protein
MGAALAPTHDFQSPGRLKGDLKAGREACRALSEWRNRHVAHRDAATVHSDPIATLPPVKAASVGETIDFLAGALTAISNELGLDHDYNRNREMNDLDVHKLLERLQAAKRSAPNL